MSFIRQTQEGSYVDIPGGSNYYIYGNGEDISGWSHGEFAALIGSVVDELPTDAFSEQTHADIREAFTEHFGGWAEDYDGGITPPERAEIFCQCVDARIDALELSETLHEAVKAWADDFDAFRECEYCGTEFRPVLYADQTKYVCSSADCELQAEADRYDVTTTVAHRAQRIMDEVGFDEGWDYLAERSPREDIEKSQ